MPKGSVAIRADGGQGVGMGHIVRTVPIAHELNKLGIDTLYVCADSAVKRYIESLGFPCAVLDTDRTHLVSELPRMKDLIKSRGVDFILCDSFYANNDYFKCLAEDCLVGAMAYGKRFTEGLDLVVSYSPLTDVDWYKEAFTADTRMLLGPRFVPLRAAFSKTPVRSCSPSVRDVLIMAGGEDRYRVCPKLVSIMLADGFWDDVRFHVVSSLDFECAASRVSVYRALDDSEMADLMTRCDLAISAAGNAVYELAALRVPMIVYAISDEQAEQGNKGAFLRWVGDLRTSTKDAVGWSKLNDVSSIAREVSENPEERFSMALAARKAGIDGLGASRIAAGIHKLLYGGNRINC